MSDGDSGAGPPDGGERDTRARKKLESRRRILESAREVFFRDGFMAANLDEIAERAAVAKGTLYRYFESKADLYVAVLAGDGMIFTEKLEEAATGAPSALEQLRTISQFYLEHWTRNREYFQIFWAIDNQAVIGGLPQPVVDEVSRLWQESLVLLDGVLQRAVLEGDLAECDTWEVANILWTLANALIQSETIEARRKLRDRPLREIYSEAVALIIRGLGV